VLRHARQVGFECVQIHQERRGWDLVLVEQGLLEPRCGAGVNAEPLLFFWHAVCCHVPLRAR
jgi:hypothetical protein